MDAAQQRIAAFHAGEKPNGAVLRVVYFHAADREALPEYAARLDRILTDISAFYREGMERRFGVKTAGLPLGRNDGKLVIHMVRGQHPAAHYQHESGDETWSEVRKALAGKFDPEHEHVLILYGLCERASDGRFVFTAPYYGATWSDHRRGLCHAADCELLDPLLLTQKEKPFVFTEHYYERMEMTVAKFNSWYLGGIAHELGHGLGFPHDNGGPGEAPGIALMGDGNLHYREDQWGGRRPAYLSLATALRFAAHPLVTQSDKARWQTADATFEYLSATAAKGTLRLVGRVRASIPPCALIASAWPATARTDHGAMTFCAAVDDDGKFTVELTNLNAPAWRMNLACLLANGAESLIELPFQCNKNGEPDVSVFGIDQTVGSAEQMLMRDPAQAEKLLTDDAIAAAPTEESRRRLRLLRAMREPEPEPIDLTTTEAARVFLSDARWSKAEVGWGKVARNRYWFIPGSGKECCSSSTARSLPRASTPTRTPSSSFRSAENGKPSPPRSACATEPPIKAPPSSASSATAKSSSARTSCVPVKENRCASKSRHSTARTPRRRRRRPQPQLLGDLGRSGAGEMKGARPDYFSAFTDRPRLAYASTKS
jgi:hypothetical protein